MYSAQVAATRGEGADGRTQRRQVTRGHLEEALSETRPSLGHTDYQFYHQLCEAFRRGEAPDISSQKAVQV